MNTDMIKTDATAEERKDGSKMTMTVEQMAEAAKKLYDVWGYCGNTTLCELLYDDVCGDRIKGDDTMYHICCDFEDAREEYDWCGPDDDVVINLIKSSAEVAKGSDDTYYFVDEFVGMYVDEYASRNSDEHDADYAKWFDGDLYMDWINDNLDPNVDEYRETSYYPRVAKNLIHDCHGVDMDDYRTYCSDDYDGSLPSDIEEKCKTAKDVYDSVIDDLYYDSDLYDFVKAVDDAYYLRDALGEVIDEISDNGNNRWWEDVYEQYRSH